MTTTSPAATAVETQPERSMWHLASEDQPDVALCGYRFGPLADWGPEGVGPEGNDCVVCADEYARLEWA